MTAKNTMIVSVALLIASATVWGAQPKPAGALLLISLAQLLTAGAASPIKTPADNPVLAERNETPEQHDARMAWWREAKFGMFIHWGLYAQAGGEWNGKPVEGGYAEWIMCNGKIPIAEYAAAAKDFNPVKYDAAKWVLAAKKAGINLLTGPISAPPAPDGTRHSGFIRGAGSSISQTINFDKGNYTASFDAVKRSGYSPTASPLAVTMDGKPLLTLDASQLSEAWGSYTSPVFAVTSGAHTLAFTIGEGEGMDLIDNVEVKTDVHKGEEPEQPQP